MTQLSEARRVAAVHSLGLLDTPPQDRFERVVRLAQQIFDVPTVAVNLIDTDRQQPLAAVGMSMDDMPRSESFCTYTVDQPGALIVTDATTDERFATLSLVTDDPGIRFYAGEPLTARGQRVGSLCIVDHRPRDLDPTQQRMLRDLADWVQKELELDEELHQAGLVQKRLLPRVAPEIDGFEVAGRCVPARIVGGDFFDWYALDDGHQVVVADVMGKGTAAALIAASVRAVLRGTSRFNDLAGSVNRMAASLYPDLEETSTFVTGYVVRIGSDASVEFVDAGHGLAVIVGPDGSWRQARTDDLPMGVLPGYEWETHSLDLAPGETLVVASDGLLDAFATPRTGLDRLLAIHAEGGSCDDLVEAMATSFPSTALEDDLTVVAIRRKG